MRVDEITASDVDLAISESGKKVDQVITLLNNFPGREFRAATVCRLLYETSSDAVKRRVGCTLARLAREHPVEPVPPGVYKGKTHES